MKAAAQKAAATAGPARVEFNVSFTGAPRIRRKKTRAEVAPTLPIPTTPAVAEATEPSLPQPEAQADPAATSVQLPRPPKITLLLVLGHHFERLVREGVVRDYAEIARRTGLTRARVAQICNLTLLAPDIQAAMLDLNPTTTGDDPVHERSLRGIVADPNWRKQYKL